MSNSSQSRLKAKVTRCGRHGTAPSRELAKTKLLRENFLPHALDRSSLRSRCKSTTLIVIASMTTFRDACVFVPFSINSSFRPSTIECLMDSAPFLSKSRQRIAHSSPRRAPVTAARRKKQAISGFRSCAKLIIRVTVSTSGTSSSTRSTLGGDALSAGLVRIHPHFNAWLSNRRIRACTWWTLCALRGRPLTPRRRRVA